MPQITLDTANTPYNLVTLLSSPNAPVAALAGAGAGNVDNGAHRYLVTFVSASGESGAGVKSVAVTVADKTTDGQVALSGIPIGPSGTTARKIYRTVAAGSVYKLQSTISNNTATTATDNLADAGLGANAPTVDNSNLNLKPPFFADLILSGVSTNGGTVHYDIANPNITTTNNGGSVSSTGSARIEGGSPVAPGDIWLIAGTAGDKLTVSGRPF